ncbi:MULTISPECIES: hypothetical protein [unclassified Methanosarcina]|uniref:hypothetical protein n=1 Tax=unclassified Methanosarcina TaxID=2644672 RepID=UPI000B1E57BF|nr:MULTISPECIES: hypothetical protein [unclassified Methanosarcina]
MALIRCLLFSGTFLFILIGYGVILAQIGILKRDTLRKILDPILKIGEEIEEAGVLT